MRVIIISRDYIMALHTNCTLLYMILRNYSINNNNNNNDDYAADNDDDEDDEDDDDAHNDYADNGANKQNGSYNINNFKNNN